MGEPLGEDEPMKYVTIINNQQYEIEVDKDGGVTVNGEPRHVDFRALDDSLYSIITDNQSLQVVIDEQQGRYSVMLRGRMFEGQVLDERAMLLLSRKGGFASASGEVRSPMPGLIVSVPISVGQSVTQGQTVVILESMKMQNELKSPIDGVVQSIEVEAGATVDKDALLTVIVAEPAEDAAE